MRRVDGGRRLIALGVGEALGFGFGAPAGVLFGLGFPAAAPNVLGRHDGDSSDRLMRMSTE